MITSKKSNMGPVGLKPKGAYSGSTPYTFLDCVLHNHDSWVCIALDANGNPITISGQEPSDNSAYWQALTDGGRAAMAVGTQVQTDFNTWFGATANAGIRKTVNDWFSSVQNAWTQWFSDTLISGVRKIWTTWFGGVQSDWTTLSNNATAAIAGAENVNATVSGSTITITDRTGQSQTMELPIATETNIRNIVRNYTPEEEEEEA